MNKNLAKTYRKTTFIPDEGAMIFRSAIFLILILIVSNFIFAITATILIFYNTPIFQAVIIALFVISVIILFGYKSYYYRFAYGPKLAYQRELAQLITKSQISFGTKDDFIAFSNLAQEEGITKLSELLKISSNELKIIAIHENLQMIELDIPSLALDRLIKLFETKNDVIKELGIIYISEILDEPFNLNNIRTLFSRGFNYKDFIAFLNKYFANISNRFLLLKTKEKMIEGLLEYALQEDLLSKLLQYAERVKPGAYKKYRPYFRVPRKPFDKEKIAYQKSEAISKKLKTAWRQGITTSAIGSTLILIAFLFVLLGTRSYFLASFTSIFLIPLGRKVSKVVAKSMQSEPQIPTGQISLYSFIIGFFVAPFIVILTPILILIFLETIRFGFGTAIQNLSPLIWDSIAVLSFLVQNSFELFSDIIFIVSFSSGCYLAFN